MEHDRHFENASDAILSIDTALRVVEISPAVERLLGYRPEELTGRSFLDLNVLAPESLAAAAADIRRVFAGERVESAEYEFIARDGRRIFGELSGSPVVRDGRVAEVVCVARDVTARKRAEEALRRNEEVYRTTFENTGTATVLIEEDGVISLANSEFERLSGFSKAEIESRKSWMEFVAADELERMGAQHRLRRENRGAALKRYEFRFRARSGEIRDIHLSIDLVPGTRKSVASLLDITDRKRAEESLRRAERSYRELFENSAEGIFQSAPDGSFLSVNPALARMLGYESPEEMLSSVRDIGRQFYADPSRRSEMAGRLEADDRVLGFESQGLRKDGTTIWISEDVRAVRDGQGRVAYYEGMIENITERKRVESELQQTTSILRASLHSLIDVIAATVEVRDPYTAGHQKRVARLALAIAAEMDLPQETIEGIRMAGVIHDIGKITVPSEILSKPGRLSDLEFALLKSHAQVGFDLLKKIDFPWPIAAIVHQHHERMDGSGYPLGLKGEAILIEARILAVADVIEAMSSHRPYRSALGLDEALREMSVKKGSLFDAGAADACLRLFAENRFSFD